ncbi:hypothetical protein CTI12_AA402600 [Artemisia annua]|uniref:Zinc knuckle CX2CX4HX4C n=1 Tax=Artemisia annua TaxID=35608 RepID=A0A2U1MAA6_ARTAN|nr:hypothetical protein CTI12_AA402600 [Artemisia annua]
MTATMCHEGKGRIGYARVLVEVDAKRGLADEIEIAYRGSLGINDSRKVVRVGYDWKPPCCSHCGIFGHSTISCGKRPRTTEEIAEIEVDKMKKASTQSTAEKDGFQNGLGNGIGDGENRKVHMEYRKKQTQDDVPSSSHVEKKQNLVDVPSSSHVEKNPSYNRNVQGNTQNGKDKTNVTSKKWTVDSNTMNDIKKSANKYAVLQEMEKGEMENNDIPGKDVVDKFLNLKVKPSKEDTSTWSPNMYKYFKESWKTMCEKNNITGEEMELEDVFEDTTAAAQFMIADELSGLGKKNKQDEVKNLIRQEDIQELKEEIYGENWS